MMSALFKTKCADVSQFPKASSKECFTVALQVTAAQINAGFDLIQTGHDQQYRITQILVVVGAAAITGLTALTVSTTDGTPVTVASVAQADLTANAKYGTQSTQVALGAGFNSYRPTGVGLRVAKTGGAAAGGPVTIIVTGDLA